MTSSIGTTSLVAPLSCISFTVVYGLRPMESDEDGVEFKARIYEVDY